MAEHTTLASLFGEIAFELRRKLKSDELIVADEFPDKIREIPVGADVSDTTLYAEAAVEGLYFYNRNGLKTEGTMQPLTNFVQYADVEQGEFKITTLVNREYVSHTSNVARGTVVYTDTPIVPSTDGEAVSSGLRFINGDGYVYSARPTAKCGTGTPPSTKSTEFTISTGVSQISEFVFVQQHNTDISGANVDRMVAIYWNASFGQNYKIIRLYSTSSGGGGLRNFVTTSAGTDGHYFAINSIDSVTGEITMHTPAYPDDLGANGNYIWYARSI